MNLNFDLIRPMFGGKLSQKQVDCLNAIVAAFGAYGDKDKRKLAYILATAKHETGDFRYMREIWGPTRAQLGYEGRDDLGNHTAGDGKKFLGRGFVQLTGRRNYADWSKRLGIDLLKEPTLVEDRQIAARILVQGMMLGTFTGRQLAIYINEDVDFKNARRVVNGVDKASLIAGYATTFLEAIVAAPLVASPLPTPPLPAPPDELDEADAAPPYTPPKRKTLADLLIGLFVKRTISSTLKGNPMTTWDSIQQYVRVALYIGLSTWLGQAFADGAQGQTLIAGALIAVNLLWTWGWNHFKAKEA